MPVLAAAEDVTRMDAGEGAASKPAAEEGPQHAFEDQVRDSLKRMPVFKSVMASICSNGGSQIIRGGNNLAPAAGPAAKCLWRCLLSCTRNFALTNVTEAAVTLHVPRKRGRSTRVSRMCVPWCLLCCCWVMPRTLKK